MTTFSLDAYPKMEKWNKEWQEQIGRDKISSSRERKRQTETENCGELKVLLWITKPESKIRNLMSGSLIDQLMNSLFNISTDRVKLTAMVWLGQSLTTY